MPGRAPTSDRRTRRLPAVVRDECRRRRAELIARAEVPWLDLARPDGDTARASGRAQAVVGVLALAATDDPAALLERARADLAPGGRLLLFEPYRPAGWAGRFARRTAPLVRACTGLRTDHPVPALVRRAGFVIATIERVTMPTPIAPLRSFCLVVTCPVGDDRPGTVDAVVGAGATGVRS